MNCIVVKNTDLEARVQIRNALDFPGCPVVKVLSFQGGGVGSILGPGTKILHGAAKIIINKRLKKKIIALPLPSCDFRKVT